MMLVDLPNHLGPHVVSDVANISVEIGKNAFAPVIRGGRRKGIMRGKRYLETMESV